MDSTILQLPGDYPDDWLKTDFDHFATLQRGKDLTRDQFCSGSVPVAGSNGIIGYHDAANVKAPGITVGRSGSVGKVTFYRQDFWAHNTALFVKDFHGNSPEFTAFFLDFLRLGRFGSGASVPTLDRNVFRALPIVIPAPCEQRKIAAVLGLVQRAIEQQEQLLVLTVELKKTLLCKLFTEGLRGEPQKQTEIGSVPESWEIRKLGDVFECLDGRRVPVRQSDRLPGPYPYYGASGVVDHVSEFIFDGTYLLVAEDGENLESRKLPIAFIAEGKFWVNNHAHVLKNRTGSMKFFEQFISHMNIKDYLSGTTRPKLNKALMTSIRLPFPKEDEQAEIADVLETVERKRSSHVRRVVALRDLFRTLVHQLMSARIRVHDLDLSELEATGAE